MYYSHRHFYCSKNSVNEWVLYAGYRSIARFKTRYYADKARKHFQSLLDSLEFSQLAHEVFLLKESDSVILKYSSYGC